MASSEKNMILRILMLSTRARIFRVSLPLLLLAGIATPCNVLHAQIQNDLLSAKEAKRPVADSHSFMELFGKLESQWSQALQKKERSGIDALLAPEFIVRNAEDPQHPVVRDVWIRDALAGPQIESFSHNTMAIRAFMGVAIVSFKQIEQKKVNGKDRTVRCFIVDVWEVDHHQWLVAERYISPVDHEPSAGRYLEDQPR